MLISGDSQLIQQLITAIKIGLDQLEKNEPIAVLQSYQPAITGLSSKPSIYLHKISTHRYGWPHRKYAYNNETNTFEACETSILESTVQIDALVTVDPESLYLMTSSDLIQRVASIFDKCSTWDILRSAGIGSYRIADIRDLFFTDDRDQQQQISSFDITLTYPQVATDVVHPVSHYKIHITST